MGMPVTTYTVLNDLARGGGDSQLRQALSRFSLFAFVIHDPSRHSIFGQHISEQFDHYDHITGEKFLFLALVEPSQSWLKHGSKRDYYRTLLNCRPTIINAEDRFTSALSFATNLGVPVDSLPCLIVTTDLEASDFVWFKTSSLHLKEQLERLSYIAARHDKSALLELIREENLDLCGGSGIESLPENISRVLSDVLSFAASKEGTPVKYYAAPHSEQVLKKLSLSVQNAKNELGDADTDDHYGRENEELDALCYKVLTLLSLKAGMPVRTDFIPLPTRLDLEITNAAQVVDESLFVDESPSLSSLNTPVLERESVLILKTALKVHDILLNQESTRADSAAFDFTPCVICFSKVFEKEINLSIGHWVRKELGIMLPDYFNRPQPNVTATILPEGITNPREIDFNRSQGGRWKPPGIGESELATRTLSRTKLPEQWNRATLNRLLAGWRIVRVHRNRSAHTDVIDGNSAIEVKESLERLAGIGMFTNLHRLKCLYRSGKIRA
jgi:hypothetical protein